MQKRFINNFYYQIKKIIFYPKEKLRTFIFDKKRLVINFSQKKISEQKKYLLNLIKINNFQLIQESIVKKSDIILVNLLNNLKKENFKKITYIYIYSYLVNIKEYRLANTYHKLLCKIIDKNSFFYFQIISINKKNIIDFKKYSQTIKFKLIFYLLLNASERNYVNSILNLNINSDTKKIKLNSLDQSFQNYLTNKSINIIGPLEKKVFLKKKNLKNSIIIRFKNNNYLKKKDLQPNVVYLNGTASKQAYEKKNFLVRKKNLNWVIYIQKTFYEKYRKDNSLNYRFASNNAAFLFNCFTELNLLQKVLLDLSIFNLEKVKLFNFDINLSKFHQVGYSIYNTIQKQKKIKMSFVHNQIVMFDFINYFYKRKNIELDNRLNTIINLGKEKYLSRLERNWKN